jgi:single-stranded DNA-binding protein
VTPGWLHLLMTGQPIGKGAGGTRALRAQGDNTMGTSITISVVGFVGGQPEVKTVGEQKVASFSVAVNRKTRSGEQTLWVRVSCWNGLVDEKYVHKGSLVQVTGEWLRPRSWVDQNSNPQVSLDMSTSRLVLLDRATGDEPVEEEMPF